jgi:hypothetical protein
MAVETGETPIPPDIKPHHVPNPEQHDWHPPPHPTPAPMPPGINPLEGVTAPPTPKQAPKESSDDAAAAGPT